MLRIFILAALLPLTATAESVNYTVVPLPMRRGDHEARHQYRGHFGEAFDFKDWWAISAELRDGVELVRLHWKRRPGDSEFKQFKPDESYWVPEKFDEHDLTEIRIIPKRSEDVGALQAMIETRVSELRARGVDAVTTEFFAMREFEPPGTQVIHVERPFCYKEAYTQSPKHFIIIAGGCNQRFGYAAFRTAQIDLLNWASQGWPRDKPWRRTLAFFFHPFVLAVSLALLGACAGLAFGSAKGRLSPRSGDAGRWGLACAAGTAFLTSAFTAIFPRPDWIGPDVVRSLQLAVIVLAPLAFAAMSSLRRDRILPALLRVVPAAAVAIVLWHFSVPLHPMRPVPGYYIVVAGLWLGACTGAALGAFWGWSRPAK